MAEAEPDIECGFCLRSNEAIQDGRVLPCTHIHCLDCLTAFYDINHLLVCPVPTCGEVYTTVASNLPSHKDKKEEINEWCDVCTKKGGDNQPAEVYCNSCLKKYCCKHEELHDELHCEHTKIKMEEYRPQTKKLEVKTCAKHKDESYSFGCKVCFTVICNRCFSGLGLCKGRGSKHTMLPLDELVISLKEQAKEREIVQREKKLEKLFKDASRFSSAYDAKTAEMVQLLHNTRDKQIRVLKQKYDILEEQLVAERQRTKVKVAKFMEEMVLNKWTALRNDWLRMESMYKHSNEVDLVKAFKDLDVLVQKLQKESLPSLELDSIMAIEKLGEKRIAIELGVTLSCAAIESEKGAITYPSLLKSSELLLTIDLPAAPTSVSQYMGCTYVGMDNGQFSQIKKNNQQYSKFIAGANSRGIGSVFVHKNRIYILVLGELVDLVCVFDSSLRESTRWSHPCNRGDSNTLVIVSDHVVLPDQQNKRITVYSLTGKVQKHVPCSLLGSKGMAMCAVDDSSVVVSNNGSSLVFKVNLTNGEVMWICRDINSPQGVTCYERQYILVANAEKKIKVLNAQKGTAVGELVAGGLLDRSKLGLAVDGNKLIVINSNQKTVQYYLFRI